MDQASRVASRYITAELDEHAIIELSLYIENNADLDKQDKSIESMLITKVEHGKYQQDLAPKAYQYLIDAGAKRYIDEFGGSVATTFSKEDRTALATHYAAHFAREYNLNIISIRGDVDPKVTKKFPYLNKGNAFVAMPEMVEEIKELGIEYDTMKLQIEDPCASFMQNY
jgi:hypothetical protein